AYLVDFKTSINPKSRAETAEDPQLGVYQLVVESGAYTASPSVGAAGEPESGEKRPAETESREPESIATRDEAGGPTVAQAELVYPRDRSDAPGPTVLVQPGRGVQPDPEWATKLVAEVAQRVLDERFHAYGEANVCAICRLKAACPKRPEGRELPS
ncbi:MAG TPA: PD-(D/E)XK nuclease family protein, partial [Actinocrinis sp.]|uniref:PD-(D/E)XK nuclease family protein n=1 Tax=Actinocrinis sp. TaxID=1920516 RepID=UPI002DDD4BF3